MREGVPWDSTNLENTLQTTLAMINIPQYVSHGNTWNPLNVLNDILPMIHFKWHQFEYQASQLSYFRRAFNENTHDKQVKNSFSIRQTNLTRCPVFVRECAVFSTEIPLQTKWSGWLQSSSPTSCIFKIRLLPNSKRAVMTVIRGLPSDFRAGVQHWCFCQPPAAEWRITIFNASRWMRPTSLSHCHITHNCNFPFIIQSKRLPNKLTASIQPFIGLL